MKKTSKLMLSLLLALVFVFQLAVPMASAATPDGGFAPNGETLGYNVTLADEQDPAEDDDNARPEKLLSVKVGETPLDDDTNVLLSKLLTDDIAISVPNGYYVSALYLHSDKYDNETPVDLLTHATASAYSADITLTTSAMTLEDTETSGAYYLNSDLISGERGTNYTLEIVIKQIDDEKAIISYNDFSQTLTDDDPTHTVNSDPEAPRYMRFVGWTLTYDENRSSVLVQPGDKITPYADCTLKATFENIVYTAVVTAQDKEMTVGETLPELTAEISDKTLDSMDISYTLGIWKDGDQVNSDNLEAGEYDIVATIDQVTDNETGEAIPAENYSISKVSGKLTVKDAVISSPEPTPEITPEPTVEPTDSPAEKIDITVTANAPKFDPENNKYIENGYDSSNVTLAEGNELKVEYEVKLSEDGKTCTVTPTVVKVMRGEEDVTNAYNITKQAYQYTLPTVTITANKPEYNSTEKKFEENGYTQDPATLQEGDTIASVEYAIGTDNKCMPSHAVIKNGNNDVTNKYSISYVASEAGVQPTDPERGTLTIKAKDGSWTYDGKAHEMKEYEQPTGLAEDDTIDSVTFKSTSTITNAGTQNNEIEAVVIKDAEGNDVTSQYSIVYQPGTLTVNKRNITLTVGNVNITDGSSFTIGNGNVKVTLSGDGLPEGQKISVTCKIYQGNTVLSSASEVGTYSLRITDWTFKDASNNTVSKDNYNVKTNDGTLTIKKEAKNLPLTVTAKDGTWTYDGKAHTCNEYDVSGLVDGDKIDSVTFAATSTITDAGTQKNEITSVVIKDSSGKAVDSDKYKITLVAGTLTVNKYPLTIKAESASKTYDGKALENKNVTAGKLASTDHTLTVSYTVYNSKGNKVNNPTEVGVYTKKITEYKIMSGSTDVTKNYDVKTEDGTLTIKASDGSTTPKTGDESNLGLWIGLLAFSAVVILAVVVFIVIKNKKKNAENIEEFDDTEPGTEPDSDPGNDDKQ